MESSLFGRLPSELRNDIYKLALPEEPAHITINACRRQSQTPLSKDQKDYWALASTCKEIWQESMSLFCARNSLSVIVTPFYLSYGGLVYDPVQFRACGFDELRKWLTAVGGASALRLRHLNIVLHGGLNIFHTGSLASLRRTAIWLNANLKDLKAAVGNSVEFSVTFTLPLYQNVADRFTNATLAFEKTGRIPVPDGFHGGEQVKRSDNDTENEDDRQKFWSSDAAAQERSGRATLRTKSHSEIMQRIKWFLTEVMA